MTDVAALACPLGLRGVLLACDGMHFAIIHTDVHTLC